MGLCGTAESMNVSTDGFLNGSLTLQKLACKFMCADDLDSERKILETVVCYVKMGAK